MLVFVASLVKSIEIHIRTPVFRIHIEDNRAESPFAGFVSQIDDRRSQAASPMSRDGNHPADSPADIEQIFGQTIRCFQVSARFRF
ncbi:hypothetical protein D3C76_1489590 [compost metagenome]